MPRGFVAGGRLDGRTPDPGIPLAPRPEGPAKDQPESRIRRIPRAFIIITKLNFIYSANYNIFNVPKPAQKAAIAIPCPRGFLARRVLPDARSAFRLPVGGPSHPSLAGMNRRAASSASSGSNSRRPRASKAARAASSGKL